MSVMVNCTLSVLKVLYMSMLVQKSEQNWNEQASESTNAAFAELPSIVRAIANNSK